MGFRFRKSKKLGATRLTATNRGVSLSIPGTGLGTRLASWGGKPKKSDDDSGGCGCLSGCLVVVLVVLVWFVASVALFNGGSGDPPERRLADSQPQQDRPSDDVTPEPAADEPEASVVEGPPDDSTSAPPVSEPPVVAAEVDRGIAPIDAYYRDWSSADGRFSTLARLIDFEGDRLRLLKREPWKLVTVDLARLAGADRTYVAEQSDQLVSGEVSSVVDGDTFLIRGEAQTTLRIRLLGIDAPEKRQDFSNQSTKALSALLGDDVVRVRWSDRDRYGRLLGNVVAGGEWVNLRMMIDGWAWHYTEYSDDPDLELAEVTAREEKRGLWADPNRPEAPWDFRDRRAQEREEARSQPPPSPAPDLSSSLSQPAPPRRNYWLNTSSNVRHNSGCKHYRNTKRGRACTAAEGKACHICGG